jgi:hypothetical protein
MSHIRIRIPVVVASLALMLATAELAQAQRGQGRFGGRFGVVSAAQLVSLEQVQAELKLNDEQKGKATGISEQLSSDRRELFQGGAGGGDFAQVREKMEKLNSEATEKLMAVLDQGQRNRLKELVLQVNGAASLTDAAVAKELKITDEQKSKLEEIRDANRQAIQDANQDLEGASQEERREKMTQLRREGQEKLLAVLTTDQRAQFEKMQGTKIELDLSQLRRGRGN